MGVIERKELENGVVECLIDSTNIIKSEYNRGDSSMIITFKAGTRYKYFDVLHRDYVRFEVSESQGSVFNKTMRKYKSEKIDTIDVMSLKEQIDSIKNGDITKGQPNT